MKHFELKGKIREVSNKAAIKAFRAEGLVPCNLYGPGLKNVLFTVSSKELDSLINTPYSFIVDLKIVDETYPSALHELQFHPETDENLHVDTYQAVLHELQFHPVTDECLHADFLAVSEDKPIAIDVPLNITGHAVGVQAGGKFVKLQRELRVSALMKDLPDQLDIDITELGIGKRIVAGDLHYDNVQILTPKETIICTVKATRNMIAAAKQ